MYHDGPVHSEILLIVNQNTFQSLFFKQTLQILKSKLDLVKWGIFKIALTNALINIDGPSMNYKICFGVFN